MNRVIINLYPVSQGGGLQNALSFLNFLVSDPRKDKVIVLVRANSVLELNCNKNNINYISIKDSFLGRLKVELYLARQVSKVFKADTFFTLFGNTPLVKPQCLTISGFAFSNIIESDVDFWGFLPFYQKVIKQLKDKMRLYLSKRGDILILETEHLKKQAEINKTFDFNKLCVVKMAPSSILNELYELPKPKKSKIKKILYLSGPHPNKNIHKLAVIFQYNENFKLYVTLPMGDYLEQVIKSFEYYGISEQLVNLGPVSPGDVPSIISSVDAMINIATLESFSNNWVEAWASNRLLIVIEKEYVRSSCNNAAVYIDITDGKNAARNIEHAFETSALYIEWGIHELSRLPSPRQRYDEFWKVINA
ncbi:hypothetical protein [Photobacterium phosphoreum]|uniref:hypothetical protein n=1 Tax=Photobacterium phosphoreum TaxID=659 RepID=UPI0039B029F6